MSNSSTSTPWARRRGSIPKYAEVLRTNSFFLTPALREAVERGQADYTPCPLSEVASLFRKRPAAARCGADPGQPARQGRLVLAGVSVDVVKSAAKCARTVIAQINPKMPRTCGDSRISIRA
jgi:acyl-CoA hydrolase